MSSPLFTEIFPQMIRGQDKEELYRDIRIEKIVTNRDKTSLKVYIKGSGKISLEELYSTERQISTQFFPGRGVEVSIINLTMPVPEIQEAPKTEEPQKFSKRPRKEDQKTGPAKKDYGPDVLYGRPIRADDPVVPIKTLDRDTGEAVVIARIFNKDSRKLQNEKILLTMFLGDKEDSIACKMFLKEEDAKDLEGKLKENPVIKIKGMVSMDSFDNELCLMSIRGIEKASEKEDIRMDNAPEKRVELHCHTQMSDMDGVINVKKLMKRVETWGHSAIAITDHGCVQAFPDSAKAKPSGIKVIYGMEGYVCDDTRSFAHIEERDRDYPLDGEMVVFDLETTGLNASKESIIEIGAVKVKGGEVVDTFSVFINPNRPLPYEIIELTGIDDSMVKDAPQIEEILPKFREFCGDLPLVAHNADFDVSCIRANCLRLKTDWNPSYIDTVPVARHLFPALSKFKLDNVAKACMVPLDNHHRAVDDAMCTARIYNKFIEMLRDQGVESLSALNAIETDKANSVRKLYPAHATILAKNDMGRINLYRLVSMSHLKFFNHVPRIPKSELQSHREGLIIGSGCNKGELFDALLSGKHEDALKRIVEFYDFLEIMPAENNLLLMESSKYGIKTIEDIRAINNKIIALGKKYGKPVVATSDAHFIDPGEEIYRRIILSEKKISVKSSEKNLYLRTTEEMMDSFAYLGEELAKEIVIKNSNMIANMCEPISPTRSDKAPPVIKDSDKMLRKICYDRAHRLYGENLPEILESRLERELRSIISNGYALMYIIAQKLVWKSNEDGYIVGSRGSVGSSLVATMAGISEVNPLPPHYLCKKCHYTDFDSPEVKAYYNQAGCDMPDRVCPNCGEKLSKDGFDIPFETFLGFKGNKEPDIDLNFSGDYLNKAHKYTEVIFGDGQTYRAGTVGTLADKTAYAYTKGYYEKRGENIRKCEVERRSLGCVGVRRTTGQHPGGIIVLPVGEEMESFTPVQHPANDMTTDIVTTHFDFHSIDSNLLKLDILGKDDPTQIKILEELTGVGVDDIPLDDKSVLSLFQNTEALKISPEDIMGCDFGTLGIPEFGTDFAMGILRDTKPQSIMDLVRIAGLSHGTDVYNGNAKELILDGKATLGSAICTRDDIMLYLQEMGLESEESFTIMESVRKGKGLKEEWEKHMIENGVPDWYIWSCKTIKYMFPKAHAAAYVMMAYRIGYFKVYYPAAFYAAYYSIKATAFDYGMMCQGPEVLMHYLKEYQNIPKPTDKEKNCIRDMRVVQEMYARGVEFLPIDIYKSDAVHFKLVDGKLLPPFSSIEGMGDKAAQTLAYAAKEQPFSSKDDIRDRGKLTQTVLDSMDKLGLLKGFSKSNQLSFFDM